VPNGIVQFSPSEKLLAINCEYCITEEVYNFPWKALSYAVVR